MWQNIYDRCLVSLFDSVCFLLFLSSFSPRCFYWIQLSSMVQIKLLDIHHCTQKSVLLKSIWRDISSKENETNETLGQPSLLHTTVCSFSKKAPHPHHQGTIPKFTVLLHFITLPQFAPESILIFKSILGVFWRMFGHNRVFQYCRVLNNPAL